LRSGKQKKHHDFVFFLSETKSWYYRILLILRI